MADDSASVWDGFDLDLIVKVARMTVLSPMFAVCVPLIMLTAYSTTAHPYHIAVYYAALVILTSLLVWSSSAWTNKVWRSPSLLQGLLGGPAVDWEKQIVVVTGGASGIGQVLVETLAVRGVTVVVLDRKPFVTDSAYVHSIECDLADSAQVAKAVARFQKEIGHPTILINNAGVVQGKLLLDLTEAEIKKTFEVNVIAHFTLIKAFLPAMLEQGTGHIVTVSSVFGLAGAAQLADYSASKHALMGLHESLRAELQYRYHDPPIRTTLVIPGQVRTPLFASIRPTSRFTSFVAPIVEPHTVAKAIIAALDTHQSRTIHLPYYSSWVWATKGMPTWASDGLAWLTGANTAMEIFVPHAKKTA